MLNIGRGMNVLPQNQQCEQRDIILFYTAFILMSFAKAFGLYSGDKVYYLLFVFCAALLALRILIMKKDLKDWLVIGVLLVPSGLIFLHNGETILLFTCLFLAASKNVDFVFSLRCSLIAYLTMIPLRVGLKLCGVIEGGNKAIYVANDSGGWDLAGYTSGYGYPHPNTFFAVIFIAAILLLYLKQNQLKLPMLCAVSGVVLVVFCLSLCKTGFIVYLAVMVALVLKYLFPARRNRLVIYCILMIFGALLLGAVLPVIHSAENPLLDFIDRYLISGRLHQGRDALTTNGLSLLGAGGVFLDVLYMDILLNSGILGTVMMYLGLSLLVWRYYKDEDDLGLICASSMILYGCMEQFPLNIIMNPFLLYLGPNVLFSKSKSNSIEF